MTSDDMADTDQRTARPDTHEMVVVHRVFRRCFADLPTLVRQVPEGDLARARVVIDHLREIQTALHHHHTGEDELLWPLLLERAAPEAELVLRMEEQHERVAELIERSRAQVDAFDRTASRADGEALAATSVALSLALDEHLADEERQILPVVERVITVAEWEALGERGRAGIPKERLLVQLGFILLECSPAEARDFMARMPLPARLAWRVRGRRTFTKEYRALHGVAPAV